jgi:hypothetical protein
MASWKYAVLGIFAGVWTMGAEAQEIPLYASPELGIKNPNAAEAQLTKSFEDPLPIVTKSADARHEGELSSCRDWLDLKERIVGSDSDSDYKVVKHQSVLCAGLALLARAAPAKQTALPTDFLKATNLNDYPGSLWPDLLAEGVPSAGSAAPTLKAVTGSSAFKVEDHRELTVVKASQKLTLTLLARGDFDHSGWEAAAFALDGQVSGSRITTTRLVVLTRRAPDVPFTEIPLGSLLLDK